MARRLGRVLLAAVVGAIALAAPAAAGGAPMPARIVAEWEPGRSAAEVGGRITVDGYGVDGLGLYRLGDGPASWLAVCVQADIGHSLAADYRRDPEPVVASAELEYLLWRYVAAEIADDSEAAALNVLSWRYAGARRRSGGPVWTGERIDVAVVGGPALTDVEADVAALAAEAGARRGPWALVDLTAADGADGGGVIPVALRGPGGPIAGIEVHVEAGATTSVATTDADGVATVRRDAAVTGPVVATASGPGPLVTWSASGSQRLAAPGPPVTVRVATELPAPTTTTTTTASSTTAPSTTTPTPATTASTTPATPATTTPAITTETSATTSTTIAATTMSTIAAWPAPTTVASTAAPAPPAAAPPTLPSTGGTGRAVARAGSVLFVVGALAVLAASGRPRRRAPTRRPGPGG